MKPRLTTKVKRGLWLIVARSPWLFDAENGAKVIDRDEQDAILAAGRYAEAHWKQANQAEEQE